MEAVGSVQVVGVFVWTGKVEVVGLEAFWGKFSRIVGSVWAETLVKVHTLLWVVSDTRSLSIPIPFSTPFSNAHFHNLPRGEFGDDVARRYSFSVAVSPEEAGISSVE